jgi:hypothetical protein
MMQDNTRINFYIKHFFINCQIKKLQPIFDSFVPPCITKSDHFAEIEKKLILQIRNILYLLHSAILYTSYSILKPQYEHPPFLDIFFYGMFSLRRKSAI